MSSRKIKTIEEFLNENKNIPDKYYTTSDVMTIDDFIEIEVDERENYDIEDVNEWIEKYNIDSNSKIIWVALEPHIAARYQMLAEDWDNAEKIYKENPHDYDVEIIDSNDGFLIPETDDGDLGFIFVYN